MDEPTADEWLWKPDCPGLQDFQILEELGRGGQGCTYKALHKTLDRQVAIKFFRKDLFQAEKEVLNFFQKETRAIARLDHPNIVKVLQVGITGDGTPYLVYEFLEGKTLKDYLEKEKTLSPAALSCLSDQLFSALSQVHAKGIVHRDIKPGNIMLNPESADSSFFHVKLLDFGMAGFSIGQADEANCRQTPSAEPERLRAPADSSSGASLQGTPLYMSPEQCRQEKVDARGDLYSLACVFYECLAGKPPFSGDSPLQTKYMHINEKPPLPDKRFCRELNAFLAGCLSKDRRNRPGSISECREQMAKGLKAQEKFLAEQGMSAAVGKLAVPALVVPVLLVCLGILVIQLQKTSKDQFATGITTARPKEGKSRAAAAMQPTVQTSSRTSELPVSRLKRVLAEPDNLEGHAREEHLRQSLSELDSLASYFRKTRHRQALFLACYQKAKTLQKLGRHKDCLETLPEAITLCKQANGKSTVEAALCYDLLSQSANQSGNKKSAESYALKAIEIVRDCRKQQEPPQIPSPDLECPEIKGVVPACYSLLAGLAFEQHDYARAERLASQAIEELKYAYGDYSESAMTIMLADIDIARGKKAGAFQRIKKMCDAASATWNPDRFSGYNSNAGAFSLCNGGEWYLRQGRPDLARRAFEDALNICRHARLENAPSFRQAKQDLSDLTKGKQTQAVQ